MTCSRRTESATGSPLLFQLVAVFADDYIAARGVRQGDALSWVLFSVGIRVFPNEDPVDAD